MRPFPPSLSPSSRSWAPLPPVLLSLAGRHLRLCEMLFLGYRSFLGSTLALSRSALLSCCSVALRPEEGWGRFETRAQGAAAATLAFRSDWVWGFMLNVVLRILKVLLTAFPSSIQSCCSLCHFMNMELPLLPSAARLSQRCARTWVLGEVLGGVSSDTCSCVW